MLAAEGIAARRPARPSADPAWSIAVARRRPSGAAVAARPSFWASVAEAVGGVGPRSAQARVGSEAASRSSGRGGERLGILPMRGPADRGGSAARHPRTLSRRGRRDSGRRAPWCAPPPAGRNAAAGHDGGARPADGAGPGGRSRRPSGRRPRRPPRHRRLHLHDGQQLQRHAPPASRRLCRRRRTPRRAAGDDRRPARTQRRTEHEPRGVR